MNEYANNSDAFKEKSTLDTAEKKIEGVASGSVRKKKTGLKELTDGFIQEDASTVRSYLWRDVLLPAVKKTIYDLFLGGLDMFFYGGDGAPKRGSKDEASWRKHYTGSGAVKSAPERMKSTSGYSVDDVWYPTRGEAERVYEVLSEAIEIYGNASVADLYSASNITSSNYTDNNYGWTDIRAAKVVRFDDGYLLKMPRAVPIK